MLKKLITLSAFAGCAFSAKAQDTIAGSVFMISGSADTYYKYDLSGYKLGNISTSFANENNSVSLGMLDISLKKTAGKTSFTGEVSFGPRGQGQSLLPDETGNSFHIQNLNISYAFTDKFSVTAGFMGTFVGYELIVPTANVNYSTSYLFSNGPFQNAGIKANYTFSENAALMIGLFNDWNVYQDFNGVSDFGAQLFVSPVPGWNAYLNVITGYPSGTEYDITTSYQISDDFKLGLNAADYTKPDKDDGGFTGIALYPQYTFSDNFTLGFRGEYFKAKKGMDMIGISAGNEVFSSTLSANFKAGGLTIIPEFRLDKGAAMFLRENGSTAKTASQFLLAAVYSF